MLPVPIGDVLSGKAGEGSEVAVRGWIWRTRSSGGISFPILRDSSGVLQATVKKGDVPDAEFEDARKALVESSVVVQGKAKRDARAPGGWELHATGFKLVSPAEPYPITKDQSEEWLRENRHLWLRSRRMVAIMKVRHTVTGAIHQFFRERGYYEFDPPILQPNQCEGGSTLFEVKYYDMKTYLSQTWQLYAEAGIFALERIYDMAPTFRAEKSKTSRHLCEFWMAEMEAAWMGLDECAQTAKDEIQFIVQQVLEKNRAELEFLGRDISKLEASSKKPFPTITYTEAVEMLNKAGHAMEWGKDLRTVEEEKLAAMFDTPVVVTHYPKDIMAFYKPADKEAIAPGPVAKCFDMLAPECGLEIVGGSERGTDVPELCACLERDGESPQNYQFYMDLRKYGSVQHSGYGVGVERVISWLCGLDNIKDAIAFPRTSTRVTP
jgi:asparaginyl-tRNA synthetase